LFWLARFLELQGILGLLTTRKTAPVLPPAEVLDIRQGPWKPAQPVPRRSQPGVAAGNEPAFMEQRAAGTSYTTNCYNIIALE